LTTTTKPATSSLALLPLTMIFGVFGFIGGLFFLLIAALAT